MISAGRDRSARTPRAILVLFLLCAIALGPVYAVPFDETSLTDALAALGYAPDQWDLALAWEETPPNGQGGLVYGCHLVSANQTQMCDVYVDSQGGLLSAEALAALGVQSKNWSPAALIQQAENPPAVVVSARAGTCVPAPLTAEGPAGPTALVALPAFDATKALAEDASGESTVEKGVLRTGVILDIAQPIRVVSGACSEGAWEALPDGGRVWAAILYSEGAVGQRVHFPVLEVPSGAHVLVYNTASPDEVYGPYTNIADAESGLWSATCFSDAVTVECYVPPDAGEGPLDIEIDRIVHVYRDFEEWYATKAAGSCNLDVACYADWSGNALAVGGIGTVNNSGSLWCTGSLIADTNPATALPYFWTAHHCVGDQNAASSIEVYWQYQRDACDGTVPNPRNVPRTTGGADYVAGGAYPGAADFTLMRLRNDPPAGLTRLGWATGVQTIGADVTCIHHPSGDYKRITFGTLREGTDTCFGSGQPPPARFHQVLWGQGTTEPGSSGSPLMVTESQLLIGQLYGGYASCTLRNCPDYFGRFDTVFPVVATWLSPAHDALDVDWSGGIDSGDIQRVVNAALGQDPAPFDPDVDHSGGINAVDIQLIVIAVLTQSL